MKEIVIINIEAEHTMADTGEHENVNESCEGRYFMKNGIHYILYDSFDENGGGKISNTIKLENEKLSIVKKGEAKSTLHFKKGLRNKSDYITAFGTFGLETYTKVLDINAGSDEMRIELEYEMSLNDVHTSDCRMSIRVDNA